MPRRKQRFLTTLLVGGGKGRGEGKPPSAPVPTTDGRSIVAPSLIQQTGTVTRCHYLFIVFNRENASFE